jgi:quercetin dioxygenase-like cupin family protein
LTPFCQVTVKLQDARGIILFIMRFQGDETFMALLRHRPAVPARQRGAARLAHHQAARPLGILVQVKLDSIDRSWDQIEQIFPRPVQFYIFKTKVTAMATHHAVPGEIVDLASWANDLPNEKTKVIIKTDEMELARLVVPQNKEFPNHHVPGAIVVHCVQGKIELTAMGKTQELQEGQLLYLMPGEPHSLKGIEDAVIVLTVFLKRVVH